MLQFFRRARRLENPDEATGAPVSVAPVKTLTREDVTSIYLQVLRRPPESEATVELHFSAHNTPEGFRASLMQSDEYRLLSTFSSGRKVQLADLDAEVNHLAELGESDQDAYHAQLSAFWLDIPPCSEPPNSADMHSGSWTTMRL
ncbi:hypothetical protein [Variovorax sp. GT1P44]|uniref:hypothetical protein n=1 Tax=Variovorax sp. GT1P44 TaxID=3443742 RepID=UPI003F463AA7